MGSSASTSNETDLLALLSFKASIAIDPSGVLSSWNGTSNFCKWPGVSCGGRLHPDRVTALDLDSLNLTGTLSPSITNLTFLRRLHLAYNKLYGSLPQDLGHLSRLQFLNLSYNSLEGNIPDSITRCSKLRCICLGANQLEGQIPAGLSNCTELQIISLRANKFHGTVPIELSTLPKLVRLILGTNNLTGTIPPSLGNLTTLSIFDLADNNLEGSIPETLGRLIGLGSFQVCINQLSGVIPPSIYNLSSIWYFHVAINQLSGTLPPDIGHAFPKLQYLFMYENQFEGPLPVSLSNASSLVRIQLAGNRFTGPVPSNLGALQDLVELLLAANHVEDGEANGWSFLRSLTNCTKLEILDLYGNRLQGRFPISVSNLSTTLQKLSMNRNQISGNVPDGIGNLVGLTSLYLEENQLIGPIPATIGKLQRLHVLSLHQNKLSGQIPFSMANLTLLNRLTLDGCQLEGTIPESFGNLKNLELLDLSLNRLTGTIPKEVVSLSSISIYFDVSSNTLFGSLPAEVGNLKNLQLLDVSENKLSGSIPSTLGECQLLMYLYMGVALICFLTARRYQQISSRKSSSDASLLKKYPQYSYSELFKATDGFSQANLMGVGSFGSVYKGTLDEEEKVVAVKVLNLQQKGASRSFMAECEVLRNIRHRNLVKIITACSSMDFNGNDFKALVFEFMPNGSLDEWLHSEGRGHRAEGSLNFIQRLNICIDIASALDYLHHGGPNPIIHCDLKPSNVLLDNDMCAHVGDFGLSCFLSRSQSASSRKPNSSSRIIGTVGYVAPEYGIGSQVSIEGDIYSFGILLLETFTGRRPTDEIFKEGYGLHKYVEMAFPEGVMEIIDPHLHFRRENGEDTEPSNCSTDAIQLQKYLVFIIGLAISCSTDLPRERMKTNDVIKQLCAVRDECIAEYTS
ncbi:LRR receptor-like serine threonine-protein kinase [Musa troglodytarum]|uniref:Receptor kinase-like protein Xa21 n=1 Tax=Musa troglodytarum TaxID=320322 RepID=A0A9E7L3P1_9LILI|nr:LRR receptor-like serine threonine-protein kinase [Musa troglodytarum]